ncbi:hypothetical protein H0H81_009066 [Sphagnurus paluster]|uniref:Uncharacterized protein n=1 Tax=Sphagnurus paluster TaxID=117069 RepID=A0A9P7GV46_9AGAR|nr:hypothetical protein H0H81_009066 [Sphagnurus paluster]
MTHRISRQRFRLPGFGLPLNYLPLNNKGANALFKNALNNREMLDGKTRLPLTSLREFTMLEFMNHITDNERWQETVFDEEAEATWKVEVEKMMGRRFTARMFDWCMAELRSKAEVFATTGAVVVYNGDIVKSDTAIPEELRQALIAAVAPLEKVPRRHKDWRPEADNQVLDLVHPSLFPLVFGKTRILNDSLVGLDDCIERCGEGIPVPVPPETDLIPARMPKYFAEPIYKKPYSQQYQWLPCDIDISGGPGTAKITSYINNLHPQYHKDLYDVIEQLISRTIPLWNMTLAPLKAPDLRFNRVPYKVCTYSPDPESWWQGRWPARHAGEDSFDYENRLARWFSAVRQVVQPDAGIFAPPSVPKDLESQYYSKDTGRLKRDKTVDIYRDYGDRGLQVIVKLANIELTPEKPEYRGGAWQVEGMLNITTSRLAFRQQSVIASDFRYEWDHHDWLEAVFGCQNRTAAVQDVGSINTREGRLLTWPNILQHQVQPFSLAEPTKPGHRKVVALFLVDPGIRIISTANVPCQQRDWWGDALRHGDSRLAQLPVELQDMITEEVDGFPVGLEEAKRVRVRLMQERKRYAAFHDQAFKHHEFSLGE